MEEVDCVVQNFVSPSRVSIWQKLGFGAGRRPRFEDDEPGLEGFAPSYLRIEIIAVLDWRERLRALVSGKLQISVATKTDLPVEKAISRSVVYVLAPNYQLEE